MGELSIRTEIPLDKLLQKISKIKLNGICEILDQTYILDGEVRLPRLNITSTPDIKKRRRATLGPSMTSIM